MSRQTAYTTISLHRKAKDGKDGQDGKDGINGQDGKDGINGQDGKDGKDGTNGIDGTSPIMLVGSTANVTIATDRSGAASAAGSMEFECRIYDGETPLTCGYELQTTTNLIVTSVASTGIVTVSWKKGDTITEQTLSLQVQCVRQSTITKTASIKVTPVAVGATGSQGPKGQVIRQLGEWESGMVIVNNDYYIDVVTVTTDNGQDFYKLKDEWTTNNGTTKFTTVDPSSSTGATYYEQADYKKFLATEVLIGKTGSFKVLGSTEMLIHDTDNVDKGWYINGGAIAHTETGLALTKDGMLSIPSGTMSFKVGSKTYTNISEAVTDGAWRSNTNLLLNPLLNKGFYSGFSQDNATSSTSAVYGITSQSFGGYTASKLSMYDGKICGIYLAAAAAGSTLAYMNYSSALKKIQLKANTSYAFSVWVKSDRTLNGLMCAQIHLWKDATDMTPSSRKHFTLVASNMGETIEGYTQCYFTFNTKTTKDGGTPLNDQYLYFSWIPLFGFTASAAGNSGIMVWAAAKLEEGTQATSIYGPSLLLDTGIDIQNRTIKLTTDNLVCENNSGERTMWLDALGNFTTTGVQASLVQTITDASPILISSTEQVTADEYNSIKDNCNDSNGNYYYLDVLRCGNVIKMNGVSRNIYVPYYIADDNYRRTATRFGQDGTLHWITQQELTQLIGKRIIVIMDSNANSVNGSTARLYTNAPVTEVDGSYERVTNNNIIITTFASNNPGIQINTPGIYMLEFSYGILGKKETAGSNAYTYSLIYYWKIANLQWTNIGWD